METSRADTASSQIIISGLSAKALAMAILCLCPPDKVTPLSPTTVCSGLFSIDLINSFI